ncbi:MAG: hypothetical protein HY360_04275 [Verrucomicrobia bacterium]|nr:hypothetical protein [Verrucomicrobiota bacterium]
MKASPRLLFVKASSDVCSAEVEHLKTVADMFLMESEVIEFGDKDAFENTLRGKMPYDYIYLAAHANLKGFGESNGSTFCSWWDFGIALCSANCLNTGCVLLLGCCRGGLKMVGISLFDACASIDYIVGPRWTVTGQDITTGFHVFIYNMLIRKEQPGTAASRSSSATGYDFFCHDRVEIDDDMFAQSVRIQRQNYSP